MLGPVSIPSKSLEAWIINGLVPISRNGNFKFYSVRGKKSFLYLFLSVQHKFVHSPFCFS